MSQIGFTLTLTSDGEPASGFGTDLMDSLLPRNDKGRVILPATHLKGIIRENLENLPDNIIPSDAVVALFGRSGGNNAYFHIDDAVAPGDAAVIDITRTALNEYGVAGDGSLRTSEAVACGTEFAGTATPHPNLSAPYTDLLRLGLLSLFAVGGGRTRGAGACFVTLENDRRTPGVLLRELSGADFNRPPLTIPVAAQYPDISDRRILLQLSFKAAGPVCVPETPVVANNMIRSGFSIPASAVQGAILHKINDISEPLATACFESENFRAWPLNPSDGADSLSLRAPFTHKTGKSQTGKDYFEDETVKTPNQNDLDHHPVPADGVLITDGGGTVLWKSSKMARTISAHGVHNGGRDKAAPAQKRNLFTVESLSPVTFTGLVSIPETACNILLESLEKDPAVRLGKARSVRGGGELKAVRVKFSDLPVMTKGEEKVFIVQSPVRIPRDLEEKPLEIIMAALAENAGFGKVKKSWGATAIRFGWNNTETKKFLSGRAVIAPGTVFQLESPVENLEDKLIRGIGNGRKNGFGAVLPHPGPATRLFKPETKLRVIPKPHRNFGKEGFELCKEAKAGGLSASQISRIRELVSLNKDKAREYLDRQRTDRPEKIWQKWKGIITRLSEDIQKDPEHTAKVLKVCQDLLVADEEDN